MAKKDFSIPGDTCPMCGLVPARVVEQLHWRECAHWRTLCGQVQYGVPHREVKAAWEALRTTLVR